MLSTVSLFDKKTEAKAYKPSHRAFRNKNTKAAVPTTGLRAFMSPVWSQVQRSSKFVRNNKFKSASALCLIGGANLYRTNTYVSNGSANGSNGTLKERLNATAWWHFKDLF